MATLGNKRAVGVFSMHSQAENALNELSSSGFGMDRVSIVARDADKLERSDRIGNTNVQNADGDDTLADEGLKTGATAGGVVGGLTGLLVGLGTLAIPGVGPIMLAGATATAIATSLAGGAIGAAAGGMVGSLVGLGIPEDRAQDYHDRVVRGEYLVIIDGTTTEIDRAGEILKHHGVSQWEVYAAPAGVGDTTEAPYLG
jgi:hypothetical protein